MDRTSLTGFTAGTRFAAPFGQIPVEALGLGAKLRTGWGRTAPVLRVHRRRVDCRHHPRPAEVAPVLVRAGAFAPGVPARDIQLAPDHGVLFEGALIPVRHLVNGATVRQLDPDTVTYWGVDLGGHDLLLADGLAVESCTLPASSRGGLGAAPPSCAPVLRGGATVERARAVLGARRAEVGPAVPAARPALVSFPLPQPAAAVPDRAAALPSY